MTGTSPSILTNTSPIQTELFRPSLQYPSHPYAEILSCTAERFPENEAVISSAPILASHLTTTLARLALRAQERCKVVSSCQRR